MSSSGQNEALSVISPVLLFHSTLLAPPATLFKPASLLFADSIPFPDNFIRPAGLKRTNVPSVCLSLSWNNVRPVQAAEWPTSTPEPSTLTHIDLTDFIRRAQTLRNHSDASFPTGQLLRFSFWPRCCEHKQVNKCGST